MPTNRIGFSSEFVLVNEQVGIGTTNPTARLDVRGQIRADNSTGGSGVSTVTTYNGFLHSQQNLTTTVSIAQTTRGNLNSLSGEIKITGDLTVTDDTRLTGGRLDSLTVTGSFDLPSSGSIGRELKPEKGSTRFNSDLGQLEFYTGTEWRTTASYDGSGRGRGVFGSGNSGLYLDYIQISSNGNALDFGTLTVSRAIHASCSSSTRGVFSGGGETPANTGSNVIYYITIQSAGNAIDFGDLSFARRSPDSLSSSTRGIFGGGYYATPAPGSGNTLTNTIDYVSLSTLGNALDFGDFSIDTTLRAPFSSSTRGVWSGGYVIGTLRISRIDYVTISSLGNAIYFGDLTQSRYSIGGCSNSIRGLAVGGYNPITNNIEYITIASTGNAVYFGDLTSSRGLAGACSSSTRGVFGGGFGGGTNVIDYVTISTTGNAIDFGDLTRTRYTYSACSDSHGGLGGF